MRNLLGFILLFVFGFSSQAIAKQCQLMPNDFDGSRKSIEDFENNIEERMTAIYQKQRPGLRSLLRKAADIESEIVSAELDLIRKFFPTYKNYRTQPGKRSRQMQLIRREIRKLAAKEDFSQSDIDYLNSELDFRLALTADFIYEYRSKLFEMKQALRMLEEKIDDLNAPHFIDKPKVDLKIRAGGYTYGDVQFEAFFKPPEKDMLKLPFIKAGFSMDDTTLVYACINFDAKRADKSAIYIYFLNTTKFIAVRWYDYITNYDLTIREMLTFWQEPKAKIHPLKLTTASVFGPVEFLTSNFAIFKPLEFVNTFLQSINFVGASMTPVQSFVFDNVGIGISSVHIQPTNIKLKYAVSTLFDLIQFDLIDQNFERENAFLNVLGQKPYSPLADPEPKIELIQK